MKYEDVVRAIGPGFHPDTKGADYESLPEGITPEIVDEAVAGAFWFQQETGETKFKDWCDPYKRALAVFEEQ